MNEYKCNGLNYKTIYSVFIQVFSHAVNYKGELIYCPNKNVV